MADADGLGGLDDQIAALEANLGGASAIAAAFNAEMQRLQATTSDAGRQVATLTGGISRGLQKAFDGLIFDGMKLSDALKTVARSMVDAAYAAAIRPVTNHLGGLLAGAVNAVVGGIAPFQDGGAFVQGRVMPFAKGGVVATPTTFPMRGGTGLMGEAGPEAILPLSRGPGGRLGVEMAGGAARAVNVTMNITTPDVQGFRRSQGQVAGEVQRALERAGRMR
jgi:phage-related minor tail protein